MPSMPGFLAPWKAKLLGRKTPDPERAVHIQNLEVPEVKENTPKRVVRFEEGISSLVNVGLKRGSPAGRRSVLAARFTSLRHCSFFASPLPPKHIWRGRHTSC